MRRREFLKRSASVAAVTALPGGLLSCKGESTNKKSIGGGKLKMTFRTVNLDLKHTFTISGFSRTVTPTVLVEIQYDGYTGYGEGGLPPYMTGQTPEASIQFLQKVNMEQFSNPFEIEDILSYVDGVESGFSCAKSAIDIALHDLIGKLAGVPCHQLFGYTASKAPDTSYTIGIDTEEIIKQKTLEAEPYNIIKVKLGMDELTDKNIIKTVRSVTQKPIIVDANQGWKDKHLALDMINWLNEQGVKMVEQPMPKDVFDDMGWVTENSPLPIFADESCQRLADVPKLHGLFHGINLKLIKCTGLHEARKMIATAEALNMKVMMGCTTESSCAISAAAQLAPRMDWADLDGNLLIANDLFDGVKIVKGKITLNDEPGIGVKPLS